MPEKELTYLNIAALFSDHFVHLQSRFTLIDYQHELT